jgi:hypothetical protein
MPTAFVMEGPVADADDNAWEQGFLGGLENNPQAIIHKADPIPLHLIPLDMPRG